MTLSTWHVVVASAWSRAWFRFESASQLTFTTASPGCPTLWLKPSYRKVMTMSTWLSSSLFVQYLSSAIFRAAAAAAAALGPARHSVAWRDDNNRSTVSRRCVNSHQAARAAAIFLTAFPPCTASTRAGKGRTTYARSIGREYDWVVYENLYSPQMLGKITMNSVIWQKAEFLLLCIRQVAAAICNCMFWPGVQRPHLTQCVIVPVKWHLNDPSNHGARMWQTTDGQTDHATEKCVWIGGIASDAKTISPKNTRKEKTNNKNVKMADVHTNEKLWTPNVTNGL